MKTAPSHGCGSKRYLGGKLKLSRCAASSCIGADGAGNYSKVGLRKVGVGSAILSAIDNIERVGAKTHSRPFGQGDRKSTRLNSSHLVISYAVFCLKKK